MPRWQRAAQSISFIFVTVTANLGANNLLNALDLSGEGLLGAVGVHGHGTLLKLKRHLGALNLGSVSCASHHRSARRSSAPRESGC